MLGTLTFEVENVANGFVWRALLDGDAVLGGTETTQRGVVRAIEQVKRAVALGKKI